MIWEIVGKRCGGDDPSVTAARRHADKRAHQFHPALARARNESAAGLLEVLRPSLDASDRFSRQLQRYLETYAKLRGLIPASPEELDSRNVPISREP